MSTTTAPASVLVCAGCGYRMGAGEAYPFRCPRAGSGDGAEHLLRRQLAPAALAPAAAKAVFADPEPDPFLRYRRLLHSYLVGRARGLADEEYVGIVRVLEEQVAAAAGRGFQATPCDRWPELAAAVGAGELWVKDETGNVTGTHKGRHLMGVMIWLRVMERLDHERAGGSALLAAASCGNAALAASVLAQAAGRRLAVFVPEFANVEVKERLRGHGAELIVCPRADETAEPAGDPCFLKLQQELARGALPFTCQGSENGLIADGGATLAWELVSTLTAAGRAADRLFVQVGGGALAAACFQGLAEARQLGVIAELPRLHAVQTEAAYPLWRAWRRVAALLVEEAAADDGLVALVIAARWAEAIRRLGEAPIREALQTAAARRSRFMWPWERPGASAAYSILDDETYDWLAVVEGMLLSGGFPVVVSEEMVGRANERARAATGIPVDPTGTAGYAGSLAAAEAGIALTGETVAVLFTGVERATAGGSAASAGPV